MTEANHILNERAIGLLKKLIATPSFSRYEEETAGLIISLFDSLNIPHERFGNNVVARSKNFNPSRPTLLLNSHHDTVRPNKGYTRNPYEPAEEEGKIFGLGSNDAGGALVSLLAVFTHFYERAELRHNIVFAATAEEEISGPGGIESILPFLPEISFSIVGEPTQMQMAVAERGLMVLDCYARGRAGHAAREEGENAIYAAMRDITWFQDHRFERQSPLLGPNKMTVTAIETPNKAHNVVPDTCYFVVDMRINELYSFEEVLAEIRSHVDCEVTARSTRLRSSVIPTDHPIVQAGLRLGRVCYGSPTTSDKALMPFPTLKMGPGDSARSHTADEYIYRKEIEEAIDLYIKMLGDLV